MATRRQLLNHIKKMQKHATQLLDMLDDHPDARRHARDLSQLIASPTLIEAPTPRKKHLKPPVDPFQPGISFPRPGVMVHRA